MKRLYILILCGFLTTLTLQAQLSDGPQLSWEDFVTEYAATHEVSESGDRTDDELELLETLAQHPLQINRTSRKALLALPFISETQVDSLLSYRDKKRGISSIGELQLIKGMDYYTRRYLSLFVRCDSACLPTTEDLAFRHEAKRLGPKFYRGKHEIETHVDLPLYQREGYKKQDNPTKGNYYTGNALHHVVRYRYAYNKEVAYGLTLEKDGGEPVGKTGFYPYDYWSGFVWMRPKERSWSLVIGDYEVKGRRGLLFGKADFSGREQFTQRGTRKTTLFRPHTSTNETVFFRGAAASYQLHHWRLMAFFSLRKLDARFKEGTDTVRSIQYSGLHRTISEIERRRQLTAITGGASLCWEGKKCGWSLEGFTTHFNHPIVPEQRIYNKYDLKGNHTAGAAASYYLNYKLLSVQGEVAADADIHWATEHFISLHPNRKWTVNLELRHFSPKFFSLYGHTTQQGSHVSNEQGILIGTRFLPRSKWEISGYVDFFQFPKPTFTTSLDHAKGLEASLKTQFAIGYHWNMSIRYRLKTKQRNITGHKYLEYRTNQKLQIRTIRTGNKTEWNLQGDVSFVTRQTGKRSLGWMSSARMTWKPTKKFQLKSFFGLFFTDDHDAAVYVYEPQLSHAGYFASFFYHGTREAVVLNWNVYTPLVLSLKISSTYLFNKNEISSGPSMLKSPWKNDLSLQMRWKF